MAVTAGAGDFQCKARLNWRQGTAYTATQANTYFALLTVAPDGSDTITELTGTGYARVAVLCDSSHWANPTQPGGAGTPWQSSNVNAISWGAAANDWGAYVAVAEMSASSGGHVLSFVTLSPSVTPVAGVIQQIAAGVYIITDR